MKKQSKIKDQVKFKYQELDQVIKSFNTLEIDPGDLKDWLSSIIKRNKETDKRFIKIIDVFGNKIPIGHVSFERDAEELDLMIVESCLSTIRTLTRYSKEKGRKYKSIKSAIKGIRSYFGKFYREPELLEYLRKKLEVARIELLLDKKHTYGRMIRQADAFLKIFEKDSRLVDKLKQNAARKAAEKIEDTKAAERTAKLDEEIKKLKDKLLGMGIKI